MPVVITSLPRHQLLEPLSRLTSWPQEGCLAKLFSLVHQQKKVCNYHLFYISISNIPIYTYLYTYLYIYEYVSVYVHLHFPIFMHYAYMFTFQYMCILHRYMTYAYIHVYVFNTCISKSPIYNRK